MLSKRVRVALFVCWACVLIFGLSFELANAASLDNGCRGTCNRMCRGSDGCANSSPMGCSCEYECGDGTSGSTTCMAF